MRRSVTLHHVAQAAGVSHTTVSMALRGDIRIKEATRHRVLEAARRLDYVPNVAARSLARGSSQTVAVVSSSFSSAFENEVLRGIEYQMSLSLGAFRLVQYSTGQDPLRSADIFQELLYGHQVDGVICLAQSPEGRLRQAFVEQHRPLVVFSEDIKDCDTIFSDSDSGSRLAAGHLLQQGCRRPGVVHGASESGDARLKVGNRLDSFTQACLCQGIQPDALAICRFHFDEGRKLAATVLARGWDGVFCAAGDLVAIGLMAGLRDLGVQIPQQMRIVGYDDLPIAGMVHPALSTIAQPLEQMGRRAIEHLAQRIAQPLEEPVWHEAYEPRLVVRESS